MTIHYYKLLTFIIFFCFSSSIYAQHIDLSGNVLDKNTEHILAYTNIQIKNTSIGTITGKDGKFYLKVPQKYANRAILFSYIGYKTKSLSINQIKKNRKIYLEPEDRQIGEIIIMPDSTLLTLLEKAYKKIPDNYPLKPTKLKGFYREFITKANERKYLYFAEAVIETYKTSYKKSADNGQVKIIKSLVNEFPELDSLHSRFYGGVFDADNGDIVKQRYPFIDPKYFKNYHYSLYRISKYQGKEVYVINFDTRNDSLKGTRKGTFYIEKSSLAYIAFEYESTQRGLKLYNKKNIGINSIQYNNTAKYLFYKNKWHYNYSHSERKFYENKKLYNITTEYITTQIYTDTVKPIPYKERINYSDFFSEKAKNYHSEDYWEEYNVLKKDSFLENQLVELYDTTKSKEILNKKTKYKRQNNWRKVLSKINLMYGIGLYPIASEGVNYSVSYNYLDNAVSFNENLNKISFITPIFMQFDYEYNYRWVFSFYLSGTMFSNKYRAEIYDISCSYNLLLNKKSKPLIMRISAVYSFSKFIRCFSEYQNNAEFEFGGKSIDAEKLIFGIGNSSNGIKPQISLEYKFKKRTYLYISGAYYYPFNTKEKLFLEEKSGNIFTRKNANTNLSDKSLYIEYNNQPTDISHVAFKNYSLNLGIMIKY